MPITLSNINSSEVDFFCKMFLFSLYSQCTQLTLRTWSHYDDISFFVTNGTVHQIWDVNTWLHASKHMNKHQGEASDIPQTLRVPVLLIV